ncbi:MAG: DUF4381 family protein [Gemmataceae bacterium]
MTHQPEGVAATVSVQPEKIDLGETATLTLALEGAVPLRVEMPAEAEKLLSPKSALMWQIKPLGPARIIALEGGRERWEQSFRMSPFFHGDRVLLAFNSLPVNGQPLTFEAQGIRVRKTIDVANAEKAVPVTGIETLPAIPPAPPDASGWPFVAGLAVVFAAAIAFVLLRRKKAAAPAIPPNEWAERELNRLERDHAMERVDDRLATDRLAAILREFVERRFSVAAPRLTTAELHGAALAAEWPADRANPLRDLLEVCDRAKFAGESPNNAGVLVLIGAARAWIDSGRPREGGVSRA